MAFGLPLREPSTEKHTDYVKNLKARLEESYRLALENACKSADKNKRRFDKYVNPASLQVGDRVLVRMSKSVESISLQTNGNKRCTRL